MNCTSPVFDKYPCGHCLNCRIQYSSMWSDRLMHELSKYDINDCSFVTLTYDDEHFGDSNELSVRDAQLFMKRLRKVYLPKKIKFFLCGEYGDTTLRKHFHAILFGVPYSDSKVVESIWKNGFVKSGIVTRDSCRYVTDYILKKYNGKKALDTYHGMQPPFRLMSKGLGKDWFLSNIDSLVRDYCYFVNGKKKLLPRYYVDLVHKSMSDRKFLDWKFKLSMIREEKFNRQLQNIKQTYGDVFKYYDLENQKIDVANRHADYKLKRFNKGGI